MSDKLNISFKEKTLWLEDKNIKYEDLVCFGDSKRNFSHNNYLKSVDLLMAILANDADGALRFRKMYQYYNLMDAVQYSDYSQYNWGYYQDYDDNYGYDDTTGNYEEDEYENLDKEVDELILERELRKVSDDIVSYIDKKHNFNLKVPLNSEETPLIALYLQNQEEVSKTAYSLCRVFGKQADDFVKRFLEVEDTTYEKKISYYPINEDNRKQTEISPAEQYEDNFEFFTKQEFNIKHRINTAKLKSWSFLSQKTSSEQNKIRKQYQNQLYIQLRY